LTPAVALGGGEEIGFAVGFILLQEKVIRPIKIRPIG
tara:strand:- start:621 stop:731 length:111 start_codon:yes stop_codon:yes gene_type:complete